MKYLIFAASLLLTGCASFQRTSTHQMKRDSTYLGTYRLDSLFSAAMQRDSVYQRDSIYVYVRGDTVTQYVERTKYQYKTRSDTVYRDKVKRDTIYISRTDSITVRKPVYVEKPIRWYNQGFIWVGKLCCLSVMLWVLFLYLKRKF